MYQVRTSASSFVISRFLSMRAGRGSLVFIKQYIFLNLHFLTSQFWSECVEACTPITLVSCFFLLRLCLDLDVLVFVEECLVDVCSCIPVGTFSLIGIPGGAIGHGVCFEGTLMSRGWSIIHLQEIASNGQSMHTKHSTIVYLQFCENKNKLYICGGQITIYKHKNLTNKSKKYNA
jgi:hypothetical protein